MLLCFDKYFYFISNLKKYLERYLSIKKKRSSIDLQCEFEIELKNLLRDILICDDLQSLINIIDKIISNKSRLVTRKMDIMSLSGQENFNKWQIDVIVTNPFKLLSKIINNIDKKNIYIDISIYKKDINKILYYLNYDFELNCMPGDIPCGRGISSCSESSQSKKNERVYSFNKLLKDISLKSTELLNRESLFSCKNEKISYWKREGNGGNIESSTDFNRCEYSNTSLICSLSKSLSSDFLQWTQTINKGGAQGKLGLFRVKYTNIDILYKFSINLDYTTVQEYNVMLGLNDISKYCPHYTRCYGLIERQIDLNNDKYENPFDLNTKYPKYRDILLMEYINDSYKFSKFLDKLRGVDIIRNNIYRNNERIENSDGKYTQKKNIKNILIEFNNDIDKYRKCVERSNIVISNIFQVLIAIYIAQIKKRFTHYDLHVDNILLKKCNKDAVFFYIFDDNNQFLIPSNGYISKIVDFGFSHLIDNNDNYLWSPMSYSNHGFHGYCFNEHRDYILFLKGVVNCIGRNKNTDLFYKISNIFKTIYGKLSIDKNGWMDGEDCYTDLICNECQKGLKIFRSSIFYTYPAPINDILSSLIHLPLKKKSFNNIQFYYKIVMQQFEVIENQISDNLTKLYIFREIIDCIRVMKIDYLSENDTISSSIIKKLKKILYKKIDSISKYVNLSKLNLELLICSILLLKNCIEGYLYHLIINDKHYQKYYDNIYKIKDTDINGNEIIRNINCLEIIKIYEKHIKIRYKYNKNTQFYIYDIKNETREVFTVSENIINKLNKNCNKNCSKENKKIIYDLYHISVP